MIAGKNKYLACEASLFFHGFFLRCSLLGQQSLFFCDFHSTNELAECTVRAAALADTTLHCFVLSSKPLVHLLNLHDGADWVIAREAAGQAAGLRAACFSSIFHRLSEGAQGATASIDIEHWLENTALEGPTPVLFDLVRHFRSCLWCGHFPEFLKEFARKCGRKERKSTTKAGQGGWVWPDQGDGGYRGPRPRDGGP